MALQSPSDWWHGGARDLRWFEAGPTWTAPPRNATKLAISGVGPGLTAMQPSSWYILRPEGNGNGIGIGVGERGQWTHYPLPKVHHRSDCIFRVCWIYSWLNADQSLWSISADYWAPLRVGQWHDKECGRRSRAGQDKGWWAWGHVLW